MKKLCRVMISLLMMKALVGCSTRAYLPTITDSEDYGTVTLIRLDVEPAAPKLDIYLSDDRMASIRNESTVTFSLPVGTHSLSIDWPDTGSVFHDKFQIELKGKEHQYFYINHFFQVTNFKRSPRREQWNTREMVNVIQMKPVDAAKMIEEHDLE